MEVPKNHQLSCDKVELMQCQLIRCYNSFLIGASGPACCANILHLPLSCIYPLNSLKKLFYCVC
jgi:hypothetical protein